MRAHAAGLESRPNDILAMRCTLFALGCSSIDHSRRVDGLPRWLPRSPSKQACQWSSTRERATKGHRAQTSTTQPQPNQPPSDHKSPATPLKADWLWPYEQDRRGKHTGGRGRERFRFLHGSMEVWDGTGRCQYKQVNSSSNGRYRFGEGVGSCRYLFGLGTARPQESERGNQRCSSSSSPQKKRKSTNKLRIGT